MTLDAERLDREAAAEDLVLDLLTPGGAGNHPHRLDAGTLA